LFFYKTVPKNEPNCNGWIKRKKNAEEYIDFVRELLDAGIDLISFFGPSYDP
jgi:hypothetical protein